VEPGLQQVVNGASDDIKATTGQYDASLGQRSNETSGKAIMARQREGDTASYHYVDNLARAVRHVARIILDMIPTVYDTRRIARILGEDNAEEFATVDPQLPAAYQEVQGDDGKTLKLFNPNFGSYDVVVTTGPSFTTRRVEAFEAMSQMTQANPQLWQVIGDQLVRNMDWPGAEDMAKRLKLTLLPQIQQMLGEQGEQTKIPPQVQLQIDQMGQQLQQLGQALENAAAEADKTRNEAAELSLDGERVEIEKYRAETERLKVTAPAIAPEQVQAIVMQTVREILSNQDSGEEMPAEPMMGAPMDPQIGPMGAADMAPPQEFQPLDMPQGMPAQPAFAPQEQQGF
jgi:preprotein translocase subunit SecD